MGLLLLLVIFDSANPSAAAQIQLYEFLVKARTQLPALNIVLIGGNHDSASRMDASSLILNALGVTSMGLSCLCNICQR